MEFRLGQGTRTARATTIAAIAASGVTGALILNMGIAHSEPAAAPPATKLDDKVQSASEQLSQAAHAVLAAEDALEDANTELPGAEQKVVTAQAKVGQAAEAAKVAAAAVVQAKAAVASQQEQIKSTQADIEELKGQISMLASQVYKAGGEYQELEILLQAQSPDQFASQLSSVRRVARSNTYALDRMDALEKALTIKLAQLEKLQAAAAEKQREADQREDAARQAHEDAVGAQKSVEALISKRTEAAKSAAENRRTMNATYNKLLAKQKEEQARAAAAAAAAGGGFNGVIPAGGSPQAIAAVTFALSQVGHRYVSSGGTGPNYGCNGFSWRAWHEAGSKWPLMLAYDQANNRRWVAPVKEDQAAPGDLIFWVMGNGTDGRGIDHVGIVVDPASGLFVAAANTARGVVTDNYKFGHYSNPAAFGRPIG